MKWQSERAEEERNADAGGGSSLGISFLIRRTEEINRGITWLALGLNSLHRYVLFGSPCGSLECFMKGICCQHWKFNLKKILNFWDIGLQNIDPRGRLPESKSKVSPLPTKHLRQVMGCGELTVPQFSNLENQCYNDSNLNNLFWRLNVYR